MNKKIDILVLALLLFFMFVDIVLGQDITGLQICFWGFQISRKLEDCR